MIPNFEKTDIYIKCGRTDIRKQISGLSAIEQEEMELNLFSNTLFLFCNRDRKILKALYWDKMGLLVAEKVRKSSFPMAKE